MKPENTEQIIEKLERGGVYTAQAKKWITPDDAVKRIEKRAAAGDTGARMAAQVMEQLTEEEKKAWAACATNIRSVAQLQGKGDYEIDIGIVINICSRWNARDFLYGYLQTRMELLNSKAGGNNQ